VLQRFFGWISIRIISAFSFGLDVGQYIIRLMMEIDGYDCVGLVGVVITLYCYGRVQWQRDYAKHLSYSVGNFLSAALIAVSVLNKWNISSFVSNICWAGISAYGIYRCWKYSRKQVRIDEEMPAEPAE